jgi:hypothetical protein
MYDDHVELSAVTDWGGKEMLDESAIQGIIRKVNHRL